MRVYELAEEVGLTSRDVLRRLEALGVRATTASSVIEDEVAARFRLSLQLPQLTGLQAGRQFGWNANPVAAPNHPYAVQKRRELKYRFDIAAQHEVALQQIGSQFVYSKSFKDRPEWLALIKFSGAVESAFGLTRPVPAIYSKHKDLRIETYKAALSELGNVERAVTPDILLFWAPDPRLREKLEDWSASNVITIPFALDDASNPVEMIELIRDHMFARDLFYETGPVAGDRFFGRRTLLQSMRHDIRDNRAIGLFGLRKSGKTSVLNQLESIIVAPDTLVILRDLESLPSPPVDPVPDLLLDLRDVLVAKLRDAGHGASPLEQLADNASITDFKRATQRVLTSLAQSASRVVLMLDEVEYITPADQAHRDDTNLHSIAQFLGMLRSLVQENANFTFVVSGMTSAIIEQGRLYGRPNPLFSWARAYYLSPFAPLEADELALSVGEKMGIAIDTGALEALYEATGGHAYLYRYLASTVVESLPMNVMTRSMTRSSVLRSIAPWTRNVAGNIKEMFDHINKYYPDEAFLLAVLREEPAAFSSLANDAPQALGHLISLGLITPSGTGYELSVVLTLA